MHKSATKCNKTIGKWCKNKHGASKIIDTFETYQGVAGAGCEEEDDGGGVGCTVTLRCYFISLLEIINPS
jgi:hypothetical protein